MTYLLYVCHVVVVVAVLHLLWVDIDGRLGGGEGCLGRLRIGPRGHGGRSGGQGRIHLLLLGLVGQVEGLRCCCRCDTQRRTHGNTMAPHTTAVLRSKQDVSGFLMAGWV